MKNIIYAPKDQAPHAWEIHAGARAAQKLAKSRGWLREELPAIVARRIERFYGTTGKRFYLYVQPIILYFRKAAAS